MTPPAQWRWWEWQCNSGHKSHIRCLCSAQFTAQVLADWLWPWPLSDFHDRDHQQHSEQHFIRMLLASSDLTTPFTLSGFLPWLPWCQHCGCPFAPLIHCCPSPFCVAAFLVSRVVLHSVLGTLTLAVLSASCPHDWFLTLPSPIYLSCPLPSHLPSLPLSKPHHCVPVVWLIMTRVNWLFICPSPGETWDPCTAVAVHYFCVSSIYWTAHHK